MKGKWVSTASAAAGEHFLERQDAVAVGVELLQRGRRRGDFVGRQAAVAVLVERAEERVAPRRPAAPARFAGAAFAFASAAAARGRLRLRRPRLS